MKIYHIERNFNISLNEQKKQLKNQYTGFVYMMSDGKKITFIAEGPKK